MNTGFGTYWKSEVVAVELMAVGKVDFSSYPNL